MKRLVFSILLLSGCSNDESYSDKIDRYEYELATKQMKQGVEDAIALSQQPEHSIKDERVITLMDYPIPEYYKKNLPQETQNDQASPSSSPTLSN